MATYLALAAEEARRLEPTMPNKFAIEVGKKTFDSYSIVHLSNRHHRIAAIGVLLCASVLTWFLEKNNY
jgi:hypothetical protein